jgi:hypothetical protein
MTLRITLYCKCLPKESSHELLYINYNHESYHTSHAVLAPSGDESDPGAPHALVLLAVQGAKYGHKLSGIPHSIYSDQFKAVQRSRESLWICTILVMATSRVISRLKTVGKCGLTPAAKLNVTMEFDVVWSRSIVRHPTDPIELMQTRMK